MKIQKLMVVLVILIMAVCITACGSKDSSDKCNCKEGACMKDGMCTEECKCPDMKDGMCPDDCMCMEDMDSDDMNQLLIAFVFGKTGLFETRFVFPM